MVSHLHDHVLDHVTCWSSLLLQRDHDEYMKKERKENARGSTSFAPKKKNISEIHALLQALSTEETKELLALQNKAEEKKDDDEDF